MEWRITGVRRWIPVLLLVGFVVLAIGPALRRARQQGDGIESWLDRISLTVGVAGAAVAVVLLVVTWRTTVTLAARGIEIRAGRRRLVGYDEITRVYRDRFTSGAVTLMLADERKVRLPAPVSGLGVPSSAVDEAVQQIRARLTRSK